MPSGCYTKSKLLLLLSLVSEPSVFQSSKISAVNENQEEEISVKERHFSKRAVQHPFPSDLYSQTSAGVSSFASFSTAFRGQEKGLDRVISLLFVSGIYNFDDCHFYTLLIGSKKSSLALI